MIRPWVIGSVSQNLGTEHDAIVSFAWKTFREVFPVQVDQFSKIESVERPKLGELIELKNASEEFVKRSFAEIIGEEVVPKDWGGERSDLYSNRLTISGNPISSAFAFKGPGWKGQEMTMAALGKKGDQISRLFSEPAELLVLQHWGTFHRGVIDYMRAQANQLHNPRLFMMIDGFTTLTLLRAYGKM